MSKPLILALQSTFTNNTAGEGGGISVSNGNLEVRSSTFSRNSVTYDGGGIFVFGATDCTLKIEQVSTCKGEGRWNILYSPSQAIWFPFWTRRGLVHLHA